jgi:hypothetical protein
MMGDQAGSRWTVVSGQGLDRRFNPSTSTSNEDTYISADDSSIKLI